MNKQRRKVIAAVLEALDGIDLENLIADIDAVHGEESEYYENMPEGLQRGEKGENAQEAVRLLESLGRSLGDIFDAKGEIEGSNWY